MKSSGFLFYVVLQSDLTTLTLEQLIHVLSTMEKQTKQNKELILQRSRHDPAETQTLEETVESDLLHRDTAPTYTLQNHQERVDVPTVPTDDLYLSTYATVL